MEDSGKQNLLDSFVAVAPFLNDLSTSDIAVAVADAKTQQIRAYVPGKTIDHKSRTGDSLPQGTILMEAIRLKKRLTKKVGKETFGFPYIGMAIPLIDEDGDLIGGISITHNLNKQDTLLQMGEELSCSINESGEVTGKLAAEAQELTAIGENLSQLSENLKGKVKETDGVLKVIKKITSQTNLLGLNASIEAARVGEQGKGFGVVADEIRKLAENSSNSLKQIEVILETLQEASTSISEVIDSIGKIAAEQANNTQQVSQSIQGIHSMSNELVKFAEELY